MILTSVWSWRRRSLWWFYQVKENNLIIFSNASKFTVLLFFTWQWSPHERQFLLYTISSLVTSSFCRGCRWTKELASRNIRHWAIISWRRSWEDKGFLPKACQKAIRWFPLSSKWGILLYRSLQLLLRISKERLVWWSTRARWSHVLFMLAE